METTLAEKTKAPVITVKRPDFEARVSRGDSGIVLFVRSAALHAHLKGISSGRTQANGTTGRAVWIVSATRLRATTLFSISDLVNALLLDCELDAGREIRIAEVMTASAAKDYVRNLMEAFSEYVRDYMSALRITGTVTIDETIIRKPVINERT